MMCKHLNYIQLQSIDNALDHTRPVCFPYIHLIATFYRAELHNKSYRQMNERFKSMPGRLSIDESN